jgi:hypothetical protein
MQATNTHKEHTMTASQAASKVRAAFKKAGCDPRGQVSVRRSDYEVEIEVSLRWASDDARDAIEDVINAIPENGFGWNCY